MVTFEVDEVEEAREPPPMKLLGELVPDSSWMAPDAGTRVLDPEGAHPLLAAVHRAFAEHRPLVLSPDIIWLTLMQGVAQHVRLNAEALRSRLVRHEGQRRLSVRMDDGMSIQDVLSAFREQLREEVGPGLPRLLSCDFSTSTDIERMAGDVVLMDTFSPYFDYFVSCICGIPRVTLLGSPEDWRSIRRRIDVIAELDLSWWTASLVPIADELVRASEGRPDVGFWREIYKPQQAYGWDRFLGWIARLFPYVGSEGRFERRNPMLAVPHAELLAAEAKREGYARFHHSSGLKLKDVPALLSRVPLEAVMEREGTRELWSLEAGVMAVEVDGGGALVPRAGVLVRCGGVSVEQLVERILAEHEATRATSRGDAQGFAELLALQDRLHQATLFPKTRPWRLLPLQQQEEIEILLTWSTTDVRRLVDLPDGTVLALRTSSGRNPQVIVRLHADQLEPRPPLTDKELEDYGGPDAFLPSLPPLRSRERVEEIPVVGYSLVALLARALDTQGSTELPVLGMLAQEMAPWEDMPPPSRPEPRKKK
ncbi:hypothetical protein BO221_36325 [Archangium sp. Cb G35]|uniref:DUF4419 domain-containing protein n=1 Tax=Archangium sp. Cb G35 TaxID=1920190 RepID=UPI00093741B2|nr:DUF4419 domain-containing protein [Archangium sp. Cb G35]OJT18990.1 hypothetical protein BO221_36325 [Archangium sp. Cb G35]